MKLSAVLIVKNESSALNQCLESLNGVDEIIVCDTGSSDETVCIARKHTDKVFEDYQWNDDFAEARNHALSKASGDWILTIDADEALQNPVDDIRTKISHAETMGFQTISCRLVSRSGDVHFFPRVYKKGIYWKGAAHNHLSVSENNPTDITIAYGYSDAHRKDPDRTFRILKREIDRNPQSIREKYYFARVPNRAWYRIFLALDRAPETMV